MDKFTAKEASVIQPGNPTWRTIEAWANLKLSQLREQREAPGADLRKLDQLLGGIEILKDLKDLPAVIRKERERVPITGDGFDIPTPGDY